MARLLPSAPDLSAAEEASPRVIGVDSDDADEMLAAMSSGTARELLSALHDDPAAPSELSDRVDTSLQNAQYHLGRLEDAGLIEVIDTVYSEKGREMKVYAPADRPLVVVAGDEEATSGLRSAVTNLLGGFALLALASLAVQFLADGLPFAGAPGSAGDGAAAVPTGTAAEGGMTAMEAATRTPAPTPVAGGGGLLPLGALTAPGTLFFAGGAAVLLVGFAAWHVRRR